MTKRAPSGRQPAPSSAQRRASAERAAAARDRIAAAQRRRRVLVLTGAIGAVVVVVAALIIVRVVVGGNDPKSGKKATTAAQTVTQAVASVPAATLNSVGVGSVQKPPSALSSAALTSSGKPEFLYIGAEYCPYCAAQRWAVAVALSRFGTFSGLGETTSSPSDVYPSTATLTFHGATYSSKYLTFVGREIQSNQVVNGQYAPLDKLTSAQESLFTKADSGGGIPFIDIGGRYTSSGASYDPAVLAGKTQKQIATALSSVSSPVAKGVDGTANLLAAAICKVTNQQPGSVCTSAGVRAAAAKLPK